MASDLELVEWLDSAFPSDDDLMDWLDEFEDRRKRMQALAESLSATVPLSVGEHVYAAKLPPSDRPVLLEAVRRRFTKDQPMKKAGYPRRLATSLAQGMMDFGKPLAKMARVLPELEPDQERFYQQLMTLREGVDPTIRPDTPTLGRWTQSVARMAFPMKQAISGAGIARGGAALAGLGKIGQTIAAGTAASGSFLPMIADQTYSEMIGEGFDPKTAKRITTVSAPIEAALESILVNPFAGIGAGLKGTVSQIVRQVIRRWAINYGKELVEEPLQAGSRETFLECARYFDENVPRKGLGNIARRMWQATAESAGPLALMTSPGMVVGGFQGRAAIVEQRQIAQEMVQTLESRRAPSVEQWDRWGLPQQEGENRPSRREWLERNQDRIREAAVEAPETGMEGPRPEGVPEAAEIELPEVILGKQGFLFQGVRHPSLSSDHATDLPNMAAHFAESPQSGLGPSPGKTDEGVIRVFRADTPGIKWSTVNEYILPRTAVPIAEISPAQARSDRPLQGVQLHPGPEAGPREKPLPETPAASEGGLVDAEIELPAGVAGGAQAGVEVDNWTHARAGPRPDALPAPAEEPAVHPEAAGLTKALEEVELAKTRNAFGTIDKLVDALKKPIAPTTRGPVARLGRRFFRKHMAAAAQKRVAAYNQAMKVANAFSGMKHDLVVDFIDHVERGELIRDSRLARAAAVYRKLLDKERDEVRALGKGYLEQYDLNYFPRMWKSVSEGEQQRLAGMEPARFGGPGSFLKARKFPFFRDGVQWRVYGPEGFLESFPTEAEAQEFAAADPARSEPYAPLEPLAWNPSHLVFYKLREMIEFVQAHKLFDEAREMGSLRFLFAESHLPVGWDYLTDRFFTRFGAHTVTTAEAFDAAVMENMTSFAESLGIEHDRVMAMRRGRWGEAKGGKVRTRFAGPESVFIHEVGHVLGKRYGLYRWMVERGATPAVYRRGPKTGQPKLTKTGKPQMEYTKRDRTLRAELRALADARLEGIEGTPAQKAYVRSGAEKEAVMLEAFLHAPEKFQEVAPTVYEDFKKFLEDHPELQPLLDIKPSLVVGQAKGEIPIPGLRTMGRWIMPEQMATLLNNHLTPGWWQSENDLARYAYEGWRQMANSMNQAQLVGPFHFVFVHISAPLSQAGQAIRNLATMNPTLWKRAVEEIVTAPISAELMVKRGGDILKAARKPLDEIVDPQLRLMVDAVITGGGRFEADAFFLNQMHDRMRKTLETIWNDPRTKKKALAALKLPLDTPRAVLEAAMSPVFQFWIPRAKIGMFAMIARDEMERLGTTDMSDPVLAERLSQAWDSVENRLGMMTYDNLFWNRFFKDSAFASIRAVGWNMGSLREYGYGGPVDVLTTVKRVRQGDALISLRTAELLATFFGLSLMGAMVHYMLTGEPPEEPKDCFHPKTGRLRSDGSAERLSFPSYAKDFFAWGTRPLQTALNKTHPLLAVGCQLSQNRDYWDTKIRDPETPTGPFVESLAFFAQQFTPFSVQTYRKYREDGAKKWEALVLTGVAVHPAPGYICKTPAQAYVARYHYEHAMRGAKNKADASRSLMRHQITNRLRMGRSIDDLDWKSYFTAQQLAQIKAKAELPALVVSMRSLPFHDVLNVYLIATDKERDEIARFIAAKGNKALETYRQGRSRYSAKEWEIIRDTYWEIVPDVESRFERQSPR